MASARALWLFACPLLLACPGSGGGGTGTTTGGSTGPVPTTTASTGLIATSTGAAEATAADSTGNDGSGCCERHPSPGCDEQEVTDCVCNMRAECCAFEWSQRCVDLAQDECGATCMPDGTTTGAVDPTMGGMTSAGSEDSGGSGGSSDACCTPSMQPGCAEDMMLEQCVCGADPFCCKQEWDGKCVGTAVQNCGAECGGGMGTGDCCMPHMSPGCEDPRTQMCVCMADPFCCNQQWDGKCVQQATQGCMACN